VLTNPRGDASWHSNPALLATFALFAMASALVLQRNVLRASAFGVLAALGLIVGGLCVVQFASDRAASNWPASSSAASNGFSWWVGGRFDDGGLRPERSEVYDFVRDITKEEEGILALNYWPIIYIRAGRLPISGHLYYLYLQEAYNRRAKGGYRIDICSDIKRQAPKVIWFFHVPWGEVMGNYEPCILSQIVEGYAPLEFDSPWYIRKDVLVARGAALPSDTRLPWIDAVLKRSSQLNGDNPIQILMTPEHKERALSLRRIGVLFANADAGSSGEAELILKGPKGAKCSLRFNLADLAKNEYRYFDVTPGRYTAGEIRAVSGGGIRVWEGRFLDPGRGNTCIVYEYTDDSRAYTQSCPLTNPLPRTARVQAVLTRQSESR